MSQSSYSQAPRIPTCPSRLKVVSLVQRTSRRLQRISFPSGCRPSGLGRERPGVPPRGRHPRPSPETGKGAEERPGRHAHSATHHEAHLHTVEAAWLGLSIGTHGHRHLQGSKIREMQAWLPARESGGGQRKRGGERALRFEEVREGKSQRNPTPSPF